MNLVTTRSMTKTISQNISSPQFLFFFFPEKIYLSLFQSDQKAAKFPKSRKRSIKSLHRRCVLKLYFFMFLKFFYKGLQI